MSRLLLISYAFPPLLAPESLLSSRTMNALAARGWDITALSVRPQDTGEPCDPGLEAGLAASIRVVRTRGPAGIVPFAPAAGRIAARAFSRLGLTCERSSLWAPFATRAARRLAREQAFDVVHSWASDHVGNVVGLALRRATGLPWVAHFSDPWLRNPLLVPHPLQRARVARLERAILREADAVVFTTDETVDLVYAGYPGEWRRRAHVIPHGYVPVTVPPPGPRNARLQLLHTGAFYPGTRTPDGLFAGLARLASHRALRGVLQVDLVGPNARQYADAAEAAGLDGIVNLLPAVPFAEVQQLTVRADVLLVIDAPSINSVFLPSKLVDYLAVRKPILGLTPRSGASAALLGRLGFRAVEPDDADAIAGAIGGLIEDWEAGRLALPGGYERVASQYDIRVTAAQLESLLRGASREPVAP